MYDYICFDIKFTTPSYLERGSCSVPRRKSFSSWYIKARVPIMYLYYNLFFFFISNESNSSSGWPVLLTCKREYVFTCVVCLCVYVCVYSRARSRVNFKFSLRSFVENVRKYWMKHVIWSTEINERYSWTHIYFIQWLSNIYVSEFTS